MPTQVVNPSVSLATVPQGAALTVFVETPSLATLSRPVSVSGNRGLPASGATSRGIVPVPGAVGEAAPAAAGGLILGDVLVAGDAYPLAQPEALADFLERTPAGQVVKFKVLRAGVLQDLDVRVGERPSRGR